jgi:TolA-binding protein
MALHMKPAKWISRTFAALLAGAVMLALAGCGSAEKKVVEQASGTRDQRGSRVAELKLRLDQLDRALAQLDQENEIQRHKIRAAQDSLSAVRQTLSDIADRSFKSADTTSSIQSAMERRLKKEKTKERTGDENRALNVLLIVCFAAFLAIFAYKMFRRKPEEPDGGGSGEDAPPAGESTYKYQPPPDNVDLPAPGSDLGAAPLPGGGEAGAAEKPPPES